MPILFVSDSGLHGDLLFALISESLPFTWEKSEFGRQKHCLKMYDAIVVNCFPIAAKSAPGTSLNYLKNISHPRVLLINFSSDLPAYIVKLLEERKFLFLCDNCASQKELIGKLGNAIQNGHAANTDSRSSLLLTRREQEILAQLTTGEPNSIIASRLHLSEHTVKNHMYNIFRKIGVKNRLQASNWAKLHLQVEGIQT